MALRLLFVGPPGSGKGTQAQRLRARGILHASSGDMLRAEIDAGTERGQRIAEVVRSGGLVADEWVGEIVANFLQAHPRQAIVLDGYPRNLAQAHRLAELIAVDAAIFFEIDDETLVRRLHDRVIGLDGAIYDLTFAPPPPGVTWRRREDDAPEITRHRLALYRAREAELRAFYQSAGLYRPLAAALSPDAIAAQLNAIVDDLAGRDGGQPADR